MVCSLETQSALGWGGAGSRRPGPSVQTQPLPPWGARPCMWVVLGSCRPGGHRLGAGGTVPGRLWDHEEASRKPWSQDRDLRSGCEDLTTLVYLAGTGVHVHTRVPPSPTEGQALRPARGASGELLLQTERSSPGSHRPENGCLATSTTHTGKGWEEQVPAPKMKPLRTTTSTDAGRWPERGRTWASSRPPPQARAPITCTAGKTSGPQREQGWRSRTCVTSCTHMHGTRTHSEQACACSSRSSLGDGVDGR